MKRFARLMMCVAAIGLVTVAACDDDEGGGTGPARTTGTVSGTVTFQGNWPTTGDVQISVYTNLSPPWVPMGPPETQTEPITGSPATYDYKFEGLDKASYSAVFVGWRDPANPMGAMLIGMYWLHPDSVGVADVGGGCVLPSEQPTGFVIEDGHLDHTGFDITADLDLIGLGPCTMGP